MSIGYRGGVSVLQLAVYAPSFAVAIFLSTRHGLSRSSGYYFMCAFLLVRIIGAICELIAITTSSVGAFATALTCNSVGLAPLTLFCITFMHRLSDHSSINIPDRVFRCINLFSLVGLILGIVGGSLTKYTSENFTITPETKASIIIFVVVYLVLVIFFCFYAFNVSRIQAGERRILIAVGISIPFIAVRLLYSIIFVFTNNLNFSPSFGSVTLFLCMSVIEEIVVVIACMTVGFTLRVIQKSVSIDEHEAGTANESIELENAKP